MTEITDTSHRTGIYGWSPGEGGVHRHRIAEPIRVLAEMGNRAWTGDVLDDKILDACDTVLVHTLHTEEESQAWEILAKLESHRLVLDVDDWMWNPDLKEYRLAYSPDVLARLFRNVSLAHVVTTPSPVIAEYLSRHNKNVHFVPNTIPGYVLDIEREPLGYKAIGYQGSYHHARDWTTSQQRHVARFLHTYDDWHFHIHGEMRNDTDDSFGGRVHYAKWTNNEGEYYRSLQFDVGIGPLRDTPFNRGKSALRAQEYAALGIIPVLPAVAPYLGGWIREGVTGFLVHPHQTLFGVLRSVADADQDARARVSAAAREAARAWTTEAAITNWVTAWQTA